MDERAQELDERAQDLDAREAHVHERESRINTQAQRVEARAANLREREQRAEQREEVIRRWETELEDREEALAIRLAELDSHQGEASEIYEESELYDDSELYDQPYMYEDSNSDAVVDQLRSLDIANNTSSSRSTLHNAPHLTPQASTTEDHRQYVVRGSPVVNGVVDTWATAGNATLPYVNAVARRTTPRRRFIRAPANFFAIIRGARVGVFEAKWRDVEILVDTVPGAIFKGYGSRGAATLDYFIACDLRIVSIRQPTRGPGALGLPDTPQSIVPTQPTPNQIAETIASTSIPANAAWYAVFRGIRTGVFPFW
ncbi:hypothetical protein HWV62_17378 [Athelia sp. TMB]|nr:hypothetical protein HWV62_17378 [Athelia sp. TMB]